MPWIASISSTALLVAGKALPETQISDGTWGVKQVLAVSIPHTDLSSFHLLVLFLQSLVIFEMAGVVVDLIVI